MTGENSKKWNVFLAQVGVMFTFFTIFFIITCQVIIKGFYKSNKSVVKQRYRSIVSFKILRVTMGLFIIISSYVGLTFILPRNYRGLATPVPFIIALVGNVILLVFLTTNEDASKYFMVKMNSFIERRQFDRERRKLRRKSANCTVFPELLTNISPQRTTILGEPTELSKEDNQNIYVIDIENAEPEWEESSKY